MSLLDLLMYISTAAFAYEGTKTSLKYGLNDLLSIFFGILSAVAGGTARDLYINKPFFWIIDKYYMTITLFFCIIALYF